MDDAKSEEKENWVSEELGTKAEEEEGEEENEEKSEGKESCSLCRAMASSEERVRLSRSTRASREN